MKLRGRRLIHLATMLAVALFLTACVQRFEVEVQNDWGDEAVEIVIAQIHSKHFDATPPIDFSENLVIQQIRVSLQPHERRTLVFNSASGGFWLRWRMLSPTPELNPVFTVDLLKGERVIKVSKGERA